ncbi:N-acyl-L-homoserine lactone synthetase [Agrobacterium larrymoorei]|uniref:Acyl-homoserine-lactone synthase n=1 Tax=Agrobacterium larrymoorei TaxID=160699 RepID=A0AAJ2B8R2_9HYPH|nr:acyl-homoserine-lactone synthase [Agrobacterium larrymoorei]MDR6100507.1 N-acyl-L-homoserine lactone synthetase [Agrobacterium larrymoorei]
MLHIVESHNKDKFSSLLEDMFELRARVFKDRLQWDVHVEGGKEIDVFDAADPLYILSANDVTGRLEGSVRLLPTTGPNMLRDVFPVLLPDGLVVESPIIWESSRFCVEPDAARLGEGRIHRVTTKLLCGLVEVGLRAGLSHIVSVYDARMARIFKASACPPEVIGTPTRIGRVMTYAGLFELSEALRNDIAATQALRDQPELDGAQQDLRVA